MVATETGIRDLKAKLSAYLRRVKAGETIVITERGRPIGKIVPLGLTTAEKMTLLVDSGLVNWNGEKLRHRPPAAEAKEAISVAELLLEQRG